MNAERLLGKPPLLLKKKGGTVFSSGLSILCRMSFLSWWNCLATMKEVDDILKVTEQKRKNGGENPGSLILSLSY